MTSKGVGSRGGQWGSGGGMGCVCVCVVETVCGRVG